MARSRGQESPTNHERWLVSYADMVTLLLALFVVLYAMGVTELNKVQELKKSIQFAFHIEGEGKTREEGLFHDQSGAGNLPEPAPLVNAQNGAMKEFLTSVLPQDFREAAGTSLDVVLTDDTIAFRAPLSAYFVPGAAQPVAPKVMVWLGKAVSGALTFTSEVRVIVEAPDVILRPQRNEKQTSVDLCLRRLRTLHKVITAMPEVRGHVVRIEFAEQREVPAVPGGADPGLRSWEERAEVILAFSNERR